MLQSRALLIALILLFSTTVPEVHSKAIFEKDRRDWMVIPDAIAAYIHEAVNKVSPRVAQLLMDVAQTQPVVVTRVHTEHDDARGGSSHYSLLHRNFLIKETTKLSIMAEHLIEKIKNLWYTKVLGY